MTVSGPATMVRQEAAAAVSPPPRKPRMKRRTVQTLIWVAVMIFVSAIVMYPLIWLFFGTFKPSGEFGWNRSILPDQPTLENYSTVSRGIAGIPMWRFFLNSTILSMIATVATVVSHSIAAYAFARIKFTGQKIFFMLMIGTLLLPFHVVIIPQYIWFNRLGFVDTYVPLLIGNFLSTSAFVVFLIMQFMRGIPRELDEAARIDGAGHPRIFLSIILPLVVPALITVAIFTFISQWNDFLGPLIYLSSPELYPLPIALRMYNDQTSTSDYGATATASFIALIPVLLFFVIFQRFIIGGMQAGAIKG